ncbi:TetR/AcrR family transcriptional regulator [Amycolatopsis cynarae]|uniref:TetR/AcrR family transcriptional regulator n=1 Tax=Amycolatopsis cynarae TaxID=2995223 RepID=A0ABY7B4U4_9PSEU|nr:TetR/AcrR family transcriptional regulator [Amycolatopsis sp. HUAS 11-8]WAL67345.1 TetR/AcrR family transcriptional regulator [Amycolatopsis sp. HUAS 11-8]
MDGRAHTGRRRNEQVRRDILAASLSLVTEAGPDGFTMQKLAERAGVSKRTIYRWWSSRAAVIAEALTDRAGSTVRTAPPPSTVDDRPLGDLRVFLSTTFRGASAPDVAPALRLLMAEAQAGGEPAEELRRFVGIRRAALRTLVAAARDRGDLPATTDVDLVTDVAFGVLWYRLLVGHAPLDEHTADGIIALLGG